MSGHSKWSQIKHAKAITDKKRGLVFSKLSKKLSVAVKEGGGPDPESNYKLKSAIEAARAEGLPNDNIERAIKNASDTGASSVSEVVYEGYGPYGTAFLVEAVTDSANRTSNNIKHLFTKHGGNLGAPGSVAWQFQTRGQILVEKNKSDLSELELLAIDAGAEDVRQSPEGLEIYTKPFDLQKVKEKLLNAGASIAHAGIIKESKQGVALTPEQRGEVRQLYETLSQDDDVIAVHTNAEL